MSAQPSIDEQLAAYRLEAQIEATHQAFLGAKTREMRLELQETMRRLISQRSPWMVAKMERERGLNIKEAKA